MKKGSKFRQAFNISPTFTSVNPIQTLLPIVESDHYILKLFSSIFLSLIEFIICFRKISTPKLMKYVPSTVTARVASFPK